MITFIPRSVYKKKGGRGVYKRSQGVIMHYLQCLPHLQCCGLGPFSLPTIPMLCSLNPFENKNLTT